MASEQKNQTTIGHVNPTNVAALPIPRFKLGELVQIPKSDKQPDRAARITMMTEETENKIIVRTYTCGIYNADKTPNPIQEKKKEGDSNQLAKFDAKVIPTLKDWPDHWDCVPAST